MQSAQKSNQNHVTQQSANLGVS